MKVLRLCSVFEPPVTAVKGRGTAFDPIGGMQNHTAELTRNLDRMGVVQTVITTRPPTAPHLQRMGGHARIIRLGLPVPWFRQFYSIPAAILAPVLAARADLVHVHLGEDLAVLPIGFAAARLHGLPLVVTIHCSLQHTFKVNGPRSAVLKTLGGWIEERGEHAADAVLVITPRMARLLAESGIDSKKVHIIPPGVNLALFAATGEDPFPGILAPRALFLGRLAQAKGVSVLVDAVKLLRSPGVQILFVGDGPERSVIERRIRELGIGDRVHLLGFVPHDLVPAVLTHADILVLPSIYEELGSVLIEAMQVGLPIVASRTGGIPEVITDGENGLLVPPGDAAALASAIDRVLTEPGLSQRLRQRAKKRARDYDWSVLAVRIHEVYKEVLRDRTAL